MIIENKNGDQLLEIIDAAEDRVLTDYSPVTHALTVAKNKSKFVLVYNKFRQQWEIPGGRIEKGETIRQCAGRECFEETGYRTDSLRYVGLMKVLVKGNYFHKDDRIEYGALYCADITDDIEFVENNEMSALCLYEEGMDIGYINEIDHKLLDYYNIE